MAGTVILNASGLGIGITDLEPVPRSFALGLLLLGIGLAVNERFLAAGIVAALGFLIHPNTMAPFWAVAVFVALRRAARPILLAPPPAVGVLLLSCSSAGGTEPLDLFRSPTPREAFQRVYMREAAFVRRPRRSWTVCSSLRSWQ